MLPYYTKRIDTKVYAFLYRLLTNIYLLSLNCFAGSGIVLGSRSRGPVSHLELVLRILL